MLSSVSSLGKTSIITSTTSPSTTVDGDVWINPTSNSINVRSSNTWRTLNVPVAWGDVTGSLSSQTDLVSSLSSKQDSLVSATNIKTINGQSVLGSGNLEVGVRNQFKVINSVADLGSAVGDEYILPENTTIMLSGTINLGDKAVRLSTGTAIVGTTSTVDGLISTNANGVVRATNTGSAYLRSFFIISPAGPGMVLSNTANDDYMYCELVGFYGCASAASVTGYKSQIFIQCFVVPLDTGPVNPGTGFILNGTTTLAFISNCIFEGLTGAYAIRLSSTFNGTLVDFTTNFISNVATNFVFLSVVSGSAVSNGKITENLSGVNLTSPFSGVAPSDANWWFSGNSFIRNSRVLGKIYQETEYALTITTVNTWVKITNIVNTLSLMERFTAASSRLTYSGKESVVCIPSFDISCSSVSNNQVLEFELRKNNVAIPGSKAVARTAQSTSRVSISLNDIIDMATNDYIEIFVRNTTSNSNVIIDGISLTISGT